MQTFLGPTLIVRSVLHYVTRVRGSQLLEEEDGSRLKRLFRRLPRWLQVTLKVLAVLIPILREVAKLIS